MRTILILTGFTMSIQPGDRIILSTIVVITPSLNFFGFLEVAVTVNDGEKISDVFPLRDLRYSNKR